MPLIVKDYVWDETPQTLGISVPLKGVKKDKIDIFSTDEYVKVRDSYSIKQHMNVEAIPY